MTDAQAKERLEFTFRNICRVAEELEADVDRAQEDADREAWEFVIAWCRSKQGGRSKALGRKGDNSWCFDSLPEHVRSLA